MVKKLLLTLLIGLTVAVSFDYVSAKASANDYYMNSNEQTSFFEACMNFMFGQTSLKSGEEIIEYMENNEELDTTPPSSWRCH